MTTRRSIVPTPYAVWCWGHLDDMNCGKQYLTEEEYDRQLRRPNARWRCPVCGAEAGWDDENYEARIKGDPKMIAGMVAREKAERAINKLHSETKGILDWSKKDKWARVISEETGLEEAVALLQEVVHEVESQSLTIDEVILADIRDFLDK